MKEAQQPFAEPHRMQSGIDLKNALTVYIMLLAAMRACMPMVMTMAGRMGMSQEQVHLLRAVGTMFFTGGACAMGLWMLDEDALGLMPAQCAGDKALDALCRLGGLMVFPAMLIAETTGAAVGFAAAESAPLTGAAFVPAVLASVMAAPIAEELFFRGYLMRALERYGRTAAVVVQASCFALLHAGAQQCLVSLTVGLMLGALLQRRQSLTACMLVHAVYNLSILLIAGIGADAWMRGMGPIRALILLMGSVLCVRTFGRVMQEPIEHQAGPWRITRREKRRMARLWTAMMLLFVVWMAAMLLTGRIHG